MERKHILLVLGLLVSTVLGGCTTVYKLNPLSRSHGLPAQYEQNEE